MTLIADSAYMANNLAKLDKNKYNKRDPNYSGVVLYYTPEGNYVYGWQYKNGNISLAMPPGQLQNGPATNSPDSSSTSSVSRTSRLVKLNRDLEVTTCYTWYETNYYEDSNGDMISTGTIILSQECTTEYTITDDDGGGSTGTTVSTGGSGGSAPATPPPCIVPAAAQSSAALRSNRVITRVVQNTDGSGFPAPTTTTNPCPEVVTTTTVQKDTITALMKNPSNFTAAQIAALRAILNQIMQNCIGQALVSSLINNSHSFTFSINPNLAAQASYSPLSNAIQINNLSTLEAFNFQEELFHAYQNFSYPNGTAKYVGTSGSANIEFEAKVLNDIIFNIALYNGTGTGASMTLTDLATLTGLKT